MDAIRRVFRQQRPFGLEQLTGLLMIFAAWLLYARPQALTFDWLEALYGMQSGLLAFAGMMLMLVCGYALALSVGVHQRRFAILTLPIAGYGFLTTWYTLDSGTASILPGYFAFALWVVLQVAHDQAEAIRQWMKPSTTS